jgi:transposase InsO family protein
VRYAFIREHRDVFHVRTMCRVLVVTRSGFYAWLGRPASPRAVADAALTTQIRTAHAAAKQRYGSPRIHRELRAEGQRHGRKRIARLMRAAGLRAVSAPRYRVTTQSAHAALRAPNHLARRFGVAEQPGRDHVWAADLTYIPTGEGWLYLAVILDLASRRVVGWALRTRLDTELALAALRMAQQHRRPTRAGLHHSDQGVQYASAAYQALLAQLGFTASMSRRGDCYDNAVVESFFATLTKELLEVTPLPTREIASRELVTFIEGWYNRQRRHSSLDYRTPAEYERDILGAA